MPLTKVEEMTNFLIDPRVTPMPTPENNGHNAHNEEITT
jgi:hypothetical protein